MLQDLNENEILNNQELKNSFLSATLNEISEQCKILKGDFFSDSFNYFPITNNFETFAFLFKRQDDNSINHFFSEAFYKNLVDKQQDLKEFNNCIVLGSSPADNYFTNLIHFLPRIFFLNEKKVNLIIHRNLSNKFRNLIETICEMREIEAKFLFIDDDFYKFKNSYIPQFFEIEKSVKIVKFFFKKILSNVDKLNYGKKIFIRREGSNYRKILNESDLIEILRKNDFEIINPNHFEILDQMKIFSNSELIISPHGSNLTNLIFCNNSTKIFEISPKFNKPYEVNIADRYKNLSELCNISYTKVIADTVDVTDHSKIASKYINKNVLEESNYYKNLILKVSEIEKLINNLQTDNLIY